MKSIRESLKTLGVEMESKYLIYTKEGERIIVVPYQRISSIELRENKVIVSTGSMDRVVMEMPSEGIAKQLFDELILQLEKAYL